MYIGWLRAAVLGANDGVVSTASLVVGVAANVFNWRRTTFTRSCHRPAASLVLLVAGTSLFFLALLGALAAQTGGARILTFSAESERPT